VLLRAAAGQAVVPADAMRRLLHETAGPAPDPLAGLNPTERSIVDLVGKGYTNPEIAAELHLAGGTTRNYVSRLMHKLGVQRRSQIIALASRSPPLPRPRELRVPDLGVASEAAPRRSG
jgi:DNA-binding NarL/FixJ family response regulator